MLQMKNAFKLRADKEAKFRSFIFACLMPLCLTACSDDAWFGSEEKKVKLEGERIPVLLTSATSQADKLEANEVISLPAQNENSEWAQFGGNADHYMDHLYLPAHLKKVWKTRVSSSSLNKEIQSSQPIIVGDYVYTIDPDAQIVKLDAKTGRKLASTQVRPVGQKAKIPGGGISFAKGMIIASNGFGEVILLDAKDFTEKWRVNVGSPLRSSPTVEGERVYVITSDSRLIAIDFEAGKIVWRHVGIMDVTALLGTSTATINDGIVYVPYSSGELYAINEETGRPFWTESLTSTKKMGSSSSVSDIKAPVPVTDQLAIVVGHADKMYALDKKSGTRRWERNLGGVNMPWVSGNTIFVVNNVNELVALNRDTGKVAWVKQLQRFADKKNKNPVIWAGPVLANERLWLVNSFGDLSEFSALTGELLSETKIGGITTISPVVSGGAMYILSRDGYLTKLAQE